MRRLGLFIIWVFLHPLHGQTITQELSETENAEEVVEVLKRSNLWMPGAEGAEQNEIARNWAEHFRQQPAKSWLKLPDHVYPTILESWALDVRNQNLVWEYVLPYLDNGLKAGPSDLQKFGRLQHQILDGLKEVYMSVAVIVVAGEIIRGLTGYSTHVASGAAVSVLGLLTALRTLRLSSEVSFSFMDSVRLKRLETNVRDVEAKHAPESNLDPFIKILEANNRIDRVRYRHPLMALVDKCLQ